MPARVPPLAGFLVALSVAMPARAQGDEKDESGKTDAPAAPEPSAPDEDGDPAPPDTTEEKKPEPEGAEKKKPSDEKPEEQPEGESDDADQAESDGETTDEGGTESEPSDAEPEPKPLPPPRADEQEPRPYPESSDDAYYSRKVLLGPEAGVVFRSSQDDRVSYAAGFAWGVHARVELLPWLGFRAGYLVSRHPADIEDDALGNPNTRYSSPTLSVHHIAGRIEPTWVATDELRLFASLGIGWSRITAETIDLSPAAPALGTAGGTELEVRKQTGVMLEYPLGLGASYDVVPRWVALSLALWAAPLSNQTGDAFESTQTVDQDGMLTSVQGLPKFAATFGGTLGLSIIL